MTLDQEARCNRLHRYLSSGKEVHRDTIMHWTGFPSPRDEPICAYVEFHNALERLNRRLAPDSQIVGGGKSGERYRLVVLQEAKSA